MATEVDKKFPPNVEPWLPGVSTVEDFLLVKHAPIGMPLPRALATVTTSGITLLC